MIRNLEGMNQAVMRQPADKKPQIQNSSSCFRKPLRKDAKAQGRKELLYARTQRRIIEREWVSTLAYLLTSVLNTAVLHIFTHITNARKNRCPHFLLRFPVIPVGRTGRGYVSGDHRPAVMRLSQ
jgi:hypothetical protein